MRPLDNCAPPNCAPQNCAPPKCARRVGAPAPIPPRKLSIGLSFASEWPLYIRLYSDMNMKREPWLPPCFMQVESRPEYRPIGPSVRMMCLMPSIGLMFRLISFVLIVSCGVTTAIDSVTPAASPARNAFTVETLPVVGSFSRLRKMSPFSRNFRSAPRRSSIWMTFGFTSKSRSEEDPAAERAFFGGVQSFPNAPGTLRNFVIKIGPPRNDYESHSMYLQSNIVDVVLKLSAR